MNMKLWKKNTVVFTALAAVTLSFAGCATTPQKMAVVNYQAVMTNHPDLKAANEELRKTYTELQKEASKAQTDKDLSPEDRMKKMEEFQNTMQEKQDELLNPIKEDVDQKLDEVMKEKGYTSVFSVDALVRGGDDITADILRKEGVAEEEIQKIEENSKSQQVRSARR